jgi:hypothetical protein
MDTGLRGPSRTALMAAMGRALHREGPPPHILDDWMAADLAGEEGRAILDNMRASVTPDRMHAFQAWTAVRSRFVEDFVESAVSAGVSQYVVLGAGIDSFAYRHPDLLERLTIFEVDHPFSQAWKRRRLDQLHITVPHNVVFSAVDFETQSIPRRPDSVWIRLGPACRRLMDRRDDVSGTRGDRRCARYRHTLRCRGGGTPLLRRHGRWHARRSAVGHGRGRRAMILEIPSEPAAQVLSVLDPGSLPKSQLKTCSIGSRIPTRFGACCAITALYASGSSP